MNKILLVLAAFFANTLYAQSADVLKVEGTVLIDKNPLTGKTVPFGSWIDTTSPGAVIHLSVGGKSYHRFKGGLTKLAFKKESDEVTVENNLGEIFSYLRSESHQSLKVLSKTMAMGVRGTKFYVKDSPGESYLCVCDGSVDVTAVNAKNGKHVAVNAGFDLTLKTGGKDLKVTKASDQMMTMAKQGFFELGYPVK